MVIERKKLNRISIEPNLSKNVRLLIDKINGAKGVELLKIEFESSGKSKKKEAKGFGKDGKVKAVFTGSSVSIPRQVHKITDDYTITNLCDAVDALEVYAIREIPTYAFDAYPISLVLLDKGRPPNYAQHIAVFDKTRKIDKKSSVAKILGSIHMPIDLIGLYKADHNPKAIKDNSQMPYKKTEVIRDISGDEKFVEADDIYKYTGNLYHSDFTVVTICEVGIETRKTKHIIPIEGGSCSIKKKRPEIKDDGNANKENNEKAEEKKEILDDILKDDGKGVKIIKSFTERKVKTEKGYMATYNEEEN